MTARVLIIDDLLPNIKLLEARLSAEYYEVQSATSGLQALAICAQGQIDVVLLDVMMPGMDGFEVCRRIKADPAMAHLPVVMVTSLDQHADRLRGLEAGADDFLGKPIDEIADKLKSLSQSPQPHPRRPRRRCSPRFNRMDRAEQRRHCRHLEYRGVVSLGSVVLDR